MKSLFNYIKESYEDIEKEIIDTIYKGHYVEFTGKAQKYWYDEMNLDQKELMLMQAGFNGFINRDELEDNGTIYSLIDFNDIIGTLEDDISNYVTGYEIDDSTTWTLGYKDGKIKRLSDDENDLDLPELDKWTSKTKLKNVFNKAVNKQKLLFILRTDGYSEPVVWVKNTEGEKLFKKYGEFEKWTNGRGELKRNYIQDDWI